MKISTATLLIFVCSFQSLCAQSFPPVSINNTELRLIRSNYTHHEYDIKVYLPQGYENEKKDYPVIYVLDADYNFGMVCYGTRHLTINQDIPEVILIGIGNINVRRVQDYTPTKTSMTGSGGADQFVNFLSKELIPFVSSSYRTNDDRTIVGHSLGGLFAYYSLLKYPDLFRKYLAVSPSLWYNDELIFKLEHQLQENHDLIKGRIYSAVGELETKTNGMYHDMVLEHEEMTQLLHSRNYLQLNLKAETLPDENHHSIFPNAFMKGMRYLFQAH